MKSPLIVLGSSLVLFGIGVAVGVELHNIIIAAYICFVGTVTLVIGAALHLWRHPDNEFHG